MADANEVYKAAAIASSQPRLEAKVLLWNDLTPQQKDAALQVHKLLLEYSTREFKRSEKPGGVRRFLPPIDKERWNQNLLLDGAQGSGKTSLLVTLLDLWNATFDKCSATDGDSKMSADLEQKRSRWLIDPSSWSVVPLGIVDLQPLPKHTPVLLHLVEPLARVLEAMEEREEPEDHSAPWLGAEPHGLKSRKAWQELVNAIVAGWDHAASNRWTRLDAENAVFEVDRAVRSHQNLVSSFDRFADHLVLDFTKWRRSPRPPLFVLPVDDADMNPGRAEELLEALRMLHHPRVVFLLTGESRLFYRLVEEMVACKMPARGSDTTKQDAKPAQDEDVTELSRNIYDKIIPASHRCEIPRIEPSRRRGHLPSLCGLNVKSNLHPDWQIPIDFMLSEPLIEGCLPGYIRKLNDVELIAEPRGAEPDVSRLSRVVQWLWLQAIEEHPVMKGIYSRINLRSRLRTLPGGQVFGIEPLVPRPSAREEGDWIQQSPPRDRGKHRLTLEVRGPLSLRGVAENDKELPEGALGAFLFADMIAFEHGVPRGFEERSHSEGIRPRFARVVYRAPEPAAPLFIGWPIPKGCTLLDLSLINFRWWRTAQALPPGDDGADGMARWFLAVVAQLATMYVEDFKPLPVQSELDRLPTWTEVARRIVWLARREPSGIEREKNLGDWALGQALLLAAPESGLSNDSARRLLDAFREQAGEPLWMRMKEVARTGRTNRLRAVLKGDGKAVPEQMVETVCAQIDEQDPDHPWQEFSLKTAAAATGSAMDLFLGMMSQFIGQNNVEPLRRELGVFSPPDNGVFLELKDKLSQFSGVAGSKGHAFEALVRDIAAREKATKYANAIRIKSGMVEVRRFSGHFAEVSSEPELLGEDNGRMRLEFRAAPAWILDGVEGERIPVLLDVVYRHAWDSFVRDESPGAQGSPFDAPWCHFVCSKIRPWNLLIPWPMPPRLTFSQYEHFRSEWSKSLASAARVYGEVSDRTSVENALVVWLICASECLRQNTSFPSLYLDPSEYAFRSVVNSGASLPLGSKYSKEAAAEVVKHWLSGLALLTAPESGLAPTIAQELVDPLCNLSRHGVNNPPTPVYWLSRNDIANLRDLRLLRIGASIRASDIKPEATEQEILEAVDSGSPDSVWNRLLAALEKIDPPKSPS